MKSRVRLAFVFAIALVSFARPALSESGNYIRGFNFMSCGPESCVQITAPGAFMSLLGGAFTSDGQTDFKIFDRDGNQTFRMTAKEANFNPTLDLVTVIKDSANFVLYSFKDEKLTTYGPKAESTAVNP